MVPKSCKERLLGVRPLKAGPEGGWTPMQQRNVTKHKEPGSWLYIDVQTIYGQYFVGAELSGGVPGAGEGMNKLSLLAMLKHG